MDVLAILNKASELIVRGMLSDLVMSDDDGTIKLSYEEAVCAGCTQNQYIEAIILSFGGEATFTKSGSLITATLKECEVFDV